MIIHLATAARPLQVGVTSREPAAAPACDAGLTRSAAEGAKSAEAAQAHDHRSDDGRKGDCSKLAGKDDHSKHDGGWKEAKNDGCPPQKDHCDPKPSDDRAKGDTYRNPGEALAKFDFSSNGPGSFG
jgi:ATP-binding cassette subfamily B protein RaxB